MSRDIHVVPVNDFREHETSRHCWCKPFEDFDGDGIVIVHSPTIADLTDQLVASKGILMDSTVIVRYIMEVTESE